MKAAHGATFSARLFVRRNCNRFPQISSNKLRLACRHTGKCSTWATMAEGDTSYSIWLIPDANDSFHTRIATEISYWAPKKNGPLFPPHVTLIGGIKGSREDVVSKTQALSLQLRRYALSCADVEMGETRHQCVFLKCNQEQYAMNAATAACKVFGLEAKPYMPHCSLLYSDVSLEDRQKVAEEARERLYGAMQSYQGLLTTTSFEAKALHLYETPFPADEATWKEVAVFALPEKK